MERFVFREDLAERHLEQRIRKSLEIQQVVSFEELCRDGDVPVGTVRALLDAMIARREVERLRPVNYEKDDIDFFCLRVQQRKARVDMSRSRCFKGLKRAARLLLDRHGGQYEQHHINNILTKTY